MNEGETHMGSIFCRRSVFCYLQQASCRWGGGWCFLDMLVERTRERGGVGEIFGGEQAAAGTGDF